MKKWVWPLIVIFFLLGGLAAILIGQFILPPEPRPESVEAISEQWAGSGHADFEAESFIHWNEDEPPVIPERCAKCHSAYGYLDYLGEDGTEPNRGTAVDNPAVIGSVVSCFVCHNESAHVKEVAHFPSGESIEDLGQSANCAECHQGTRSRTDVENATANLPEDEINENLSFINVHYKIAAAVRYGGEVVAGYEYPGMTYVGFYPHVEDYQLCTDCHNPHTLLLNPSECAACHPAVSNYGDLRDVRTEGTPDFDGDGDTTEGIYDELSTIHDMLYRAIQTYSDEAIGQPILYGSQFPYWYIDTNGNGEADEGEINFGNQYGSWTPRLVKATYNYHLVVEDPGGFMHNARYLIQLMYDTMNDLSDAVEIDISGLIRPE
jgi:hypothetical protein